MTVLEQLAYYPSAPSFYIDRITLSAGGDIMQRLLSYL